MSVLMGKRFGASLDFLFSLSCKRHCVGSDVGMTVCRPAALRRPRSCLRQRAASGGKLSSLGFGWLLNPQGFTACCFLKHMCWSRRMLTGHTHCCD